MAQLKYFIFGSLMLSFLFGCKVTVSLKDGSWPTNIETFSVMAFRNNAPNAPVDYGQNFTEALKDELLGRSPYNLVPRKGELKIEGKINSYYIQPVAIQSNDVAAQNRLTISIAVKADFPEEENSVEPSRDFEMNFSRFADFSSDQDINSVEAGLLEEINEQLVQDIINKIISGGW